MQELTKYRLESGGDHAPRPCYICDYWATTYRSRLGVAICLECQDRFEIPGTKPGIEETKIELDAIKDKDDEWDDATPPLYPIFPGA